MTTTASPRSVSPVDGWRGKKVRLGYEYEVTLGKMLDAGKSQSDDALLLPYIRAANIQDFGLALDDVNTMPFSPDEAARLDLRAGDLLVVEGGAVGTVVRLDRDLPGYSFQKTVNRIRARSNRSTRLLAYVLRAYRDAGYFEMLCAGSTIAHLTAEKLTALAIPDLPSHEQEAIADFLDEQTSRIDTLIDKQTQLITTLRERRSATVEAEIPAGPLAPLRSKASLIQTGPFGSQISAGSYVDGGTPVINPSHIGSRGITPDAAVSVDEALARELSRHALQPGDVVLARRGELGRCAVVTATEAGYICGTGSLMVRLRPDAADPDFMQLVIASGRARHYLESTSVGSTMNNLNASIIGDLRVPALSMAEQKSLVAKVRESTSRIDLVIRKAEQHIVLAKERRSALITAAVTGQIDVRTAGRATQRVA